MAGFYDTLDPQDRKTALAMALLQAGASMTQRTREPQNFLSNLTRGMAAGGEAYLGTAGALQNQRMKDLQRQIYQNQIDKQKREEEALASLSTGMDTPIEETRTFNAPVPADMASQYIPPPNVAPPESPLNWQSRLMENASGAPMLTPEQPAAPDWNPSTAYMGNVNVPMSVTQTRMPGINDYMQKYGQIAPKLGPEHVERFLKYQQDRELKQQTLEEAKLRRIDTISTNLMKNVAPEARATVYKSYQKMDKSLPDMPDEAWTEGRVTIKGPNGEPLSIDVKTWLENKTKEATEAERQADRQEMLAFRRDAQAENADIRRQSIAQRESQNNWFDKMMQKDELDRQKQAREQRFKDVASYKKEVKDLDTEYNKSRITMGATPMSNEEYNSNLKAIYNRYNLWPEGSETKTSKQQAQQVTKGTTVDSLPTGKTNLTEGTIARDTITGKVARVVRNGQWVNP
jgi:hypothetical protein